MEIWTQINKTKCFVLVFFFLKNETSLVDNESGIQKKE